MDQFNPFLLGQFGRVFQEYNTCDKGTRLYTNIVGHNLAPGTTLSAELECLELGSDTRLYLDNEDRWYPNAGLGNVSTSGETTWSYELEAVLLTSSNNLLRYRVTISDGIGATFTKTLERKFANSISAYYPPAAGRVEVTNALRTIPANTSGGTATIAGVCLEDGCTFTAVPEVGYIFEGWYSDQACTALLSTDAQYRHRPSSALDKIYTKWNITTSYTFDINCTESNKNSTYMFNTNSVSITSGDYTGNVTVEINNLTGGVLATQQSYPLTINAGQTLSLGEVKFVPTQIGEVSYAIVVKNAAGIPIASKTITNTAVATKLTPTIEIKYGSLYSRASYNYYGTTKTWGGYKEVNLMVWFSPMLDYPAPLGTKKLLEVKLSPKYVYMVSESYEPDPYANPGRWELQWIGISSGVTSFNGISAQYAESQELSERYILAREGDRVGSDIPDMIYPHTFGETYLLKPEYQTAIDIGMAVSYTKYTMAASLNPDPLEVQLSSKISGLPLIIETNIRRITYLNNL